MGRMPHDIRIWGRIVGVHSTKQFVRHLLTPTSFYGCIIKEIREKSKEQVLRMEQAELLQFIFLRGREVWKKDL